ncbi:DUF1275 family protein [Paraburkholderia phymatum]|uniref:DUF1275 family protein n=1 Tax=Paraburkholderia phymatum TaxID=148447 RepID=A0ACC6UC84_9BURK
MLEAGQRAQRYVDSRRNVRQGGNVWRAKVLSAVAGFVDAACFLGLSQVFTAHVTGNLAALARALVIASNVVELRVEDARHVGC